MQTKPKISMIAAVAKNLAIGKNNQLLWHLPEDLKRFKEVTSGHAVIMGSKTFESLGKALPNRVNIVIALDPNYQAPGALVVHTIEDAVKLAKENEPEEVFIIGGGSIYKQFLPMTDKLYITRVEKDFDADTFFPAYEDQFKKTVYSRPGNSEDLPYTFLELER